MTEREVEARLSPSDVALGDGHCRRKLQAQHVDITRPMSYRTDGQGGFIVTGYAAQYCVL